MKKLIAFDLDGTLTESKQSITPEMANLISSLSLKAKVIIISGGSYHQFHEQFLPQIIKTQSNLQNIILLPTSGSCRYEYDAETKDWKEVYTHPFPQDIKNHALYELNKIVNEQKSDFSIPSEHFGPYIEDRGNQLTFSAMGQEAPLEEKSQWDSNGNKRRKIKDFLEKNIPEIDAHIGGMTSVDVLPKGFDKAVGLKLLLEEQKCSTSDILFIGDAVFEGGNDYSPMKAGIETVGIKGPDETSKLITTLLQG